MSILNVNENKFLESIKNGVAMTLAIATLATCVGCASNNSNGKGSAVTSSIVQSAEDTKNAKTYDWSNAEEVAKAVDEEANKLLFVSDVDDVEISENKYAAMVCENKDVFGDTYYRLVDNAGMYVDGGYYKDIKQVDDHTLICTMDPIADRTNFGEKVKYTIFDQITGDSVDIDAYNITSYGGVIVKNNYTISNGVGELSYELINKDGSRASKDVYSKVTYDTDTGILYLSKMKDETTEVIDLETQKVRNFKGTVTVAEKGYVVIENSGESGIATKVLYVDNLDDEPATLLSYDNRKISIGVVDDENPLFIVSAGDYVAGNSEILFVDKNNNLLAKDKYYFTTRDYEAGLILCFKTVQIDNNKRTVLMDVYNGLGEKVSENSSCDVCNFIPNSDLVVAKNKDTGKYSIYNYKDGSLLVTRQFDMIYDYPIFEEHEDGNSSIVDCYLIARNAETKETVIYTKDLEIVVDPSDCGLLVAQDLAYNHYNQKVAAKQLTK